MRRALRITAWSLAGLVLLLVLTIITVLIAGNTPGGRKLLERETAQITSGQIHIAGLTGAFPSSLEIARLELSDPRGVWLTAQRVSLHWSPLALAGWRLHVRSFEADQADVTRRPITSSASTRSSPLPAIDIDHLAIGTLELEPAAAGMQARLKVAGRLHYRSMEDARASLIVRRTNGTGDYELALNLTPSRMTGSLGLEEPAGGPIEHLVNLPGLGAVSVAASLDGPRSAERVRLLAHVGAARATVRGTVDLEHRSADLFYRLDSPQMTPTPDLSWNRITLQGRWHGPLEAPQTSSLLHIEGLKLPDGGELGTLQADVLADGRLLTMRATADGITLPGSQPQLLQGSPVRLHAAMRLDATGRPLEIDLSHRLLEVSARAVTAGARSATFELRLPNLAPLAAIEKEDVRGSLTLWGKAAEEGAVIHLDVNGRGDLAGPSPAARLLGTNARLRLAAALTKSRAELEKLELSGQALSVSATGSAERAAAGASGGAVRALRARWRISVPNLALISPAVAGDLETSGTASGPLRALAADVRARSRLSMHGSQPGTLEASFKVRGLPSHPQGTVSASGNFDGAPLRLDASLERVRGNAFRVVVQRTAWKSLFVNGDVTAGPNLAASGGSLRLRIDRLSDLQRLVGTKLDGSIAGNVALIPARRARVQLELAARDVVADGIAGNARLSVTGPFDALRIALDAQSRDLGGAPASLSSAARLDETAHVLELQRFQARYHGQTVRLLSPSRVVFNKGLRVRDLRLGAERAVVAIDGELSPAVNLRASVRNIDAALVDSFVPNLLAHGTFNAEAQLHGRSSALVGQASLEIAGLKLANDAAQGLPALDAHASARFRGSTADVSAELAAGRESQLRLSGRAPLSGAGAVALKLVGRMDLALANSILEERGEQAAGTLTIDATVAGTAHTPQIGGEIRLAKGDLRDYAEGIHLGSINARLVGGQGVLRIASLTAHAGPGELSAKGTVGVLEPQIPIELQLVAHRLQPITNDILTANLDTNVRVAGTLRQRIDVTGTIHVNRASISIPNGFPPSVTVLNVVRPGESPQPSATASRLVIGLGITMDAPEAIFVQGRGLDAQLGGKLEVSGTSDSPQVNGGFSMTRGTFSLAGTNLQFTSGKVSFNGEGLKGKIDPTLDFLAEASVTYNAPTTVMLHITGFADAPKMSLTSTPPLPQDDLLGLLLFGKPASQLTAFQLAETGAALASLSGIGGGSGGGKSWNPLTRIKNALGLNSLSVGGASPSGGTAPAGGGAAGAGSQMPGASVTAGKYVSNKVYVAATQSTTGTSQVEVDVALSQHLKLQTRLGNGTATAQGTTPENDPGSSIGLAYQFQYGSP
jgi:translocation and assembly module TamB